MRFWGAKPSPTALQAAKGERLRYTGKNVEERQTTKKQKTIVCPTSVFTRLEWFETLLLDRLRSSRP